jgi:hypothetical protein
MTRFKEPRMSTASSSALITDNGRQVLLRVRGRFYEMSQNELRAALGLPEGPLGLGITIEGERMTFEFASDNLRVELSARQLQRRLANHVGSKSGC